MSTTLKKKKMKEIMMIIKKSNHVYIGKEVRNVERKQHHHSRMVGLNGKYLPTNEFVCYQQVC